MGLSIPMAAGAAMAKNEGLALGVAALAAAAITLPSARRRLVLFPAVAAVAAYMPWSVWARVQGLPNDFLSSKSLSSLPHNLDRFGPVVQHMARYWPGPKIVGLVVVIAALGYAFAMLPAVRRVLTFLLLCLLFSMLGLIFIYLVSPQSGQQFWFSSMLRVLVTPGALVWMIGVLSAGFAVIHAGTGNDKPDAPALTPAATP
jgi:hypothetical protein